MAVAGGAGLPGHSEMSIQLFGLPLEEEGLEADLHLHLLNSLPKVFLCLI